MVKDFETELRAVIKRSGPGSRSRVEQDLKALRAAGVNSFESLVEVLNQKNARLQVRLSACWLIGQLRDKSAVGSLLVIFSDDPAFTWEAAKALGMIHSKRAVVPLINSLLEGKDTEQQAAAAYGLGLLGDKRSVESLLKVLRDRNIDPKVRGHAAEALAHSGDDHAVDSLITALKDPAAEVRFWASFALGQLGKKKALAELERLALEDTAILPGWGRVSQEAAEAIEDINARDSRNC
jgi:HEAT repeat protein